MARPFRLLGRDAIRLSLPQAEVLDRGRQRLRFVRPAVGDDFCGIPLKAVVVQDVAICSGIVITAHPKADEIPLLWTVSEPTSASDLIHIYSELSHTWLRSGYQQSRSYEKNIPFHGYSPLLLQHFTADRSPSATQPSRFLADGIGTTLSSSRCFSGAKRHRRMSGGSDN